MINLTIISLNIIILGIITLTMIVFKKYIQSPNDQLCKVLMINSDQIIQLNSGH